MATRQDVRLVQGRPLRLSLRRSGKARRLTVHVGVRRGVEVVMPRWATLRDVDDLLNQSEAWLATQADTYGVWDGPRRRSWTDGDLVPLLGDELVLELALLEAGRQRPRAILRPGVLRLELPAPDLLDPRPALERWLRGFAGRELRRRTEDWAARTGLYPARVIVGDRTSRWGSCSSRGTVSLCYRLVMAPPEVVDAVVIHELCHLVHPNHGRRFHALVRRFCPDHDDWMDWLSEAGHTLEI
ncbi:MAG: SprT family zinc-dependent metalloprotease [Candidatus Krumholzibacteriia bacterium]